MYCVKVNNIVNGRFFSASFESETEANNWINSCKLKNSWGYGSRFVTLEDDYDPSLVVSQEFGVDEDGNATSSIELKAEYEINGPFLVDENGNTPESKELRLQKAQKEAEFFKKMVDFGSLIEVYFASLINKRNFTQTQKDNIQANLDIIAIREELKFGRIAKAKSMVDSLVADESLIFQEDINKLSLLMQDFIESL